MVWMFVSFVCDGRLELDGFKQKMGDLLTPVTWMLSSPAPNQNNQLEHGVIISFFVFSLLAKCLFH